MRDDRLNRLRSLPELTPYTDQEIRSLLPYFDEVRVPAGTVVGRQGAPCAQYVVLLEGRLLGAGASSGWDAMWQRGDNCATLVAGTDARLLVMGRSGFRAVVALGRRQVRVVVGDQGSGRRPAPGVRDRVA